MFVRFVSACAIFPLPPLSLLCDFLILSVRRDIWQIMERKINVNKTVFRNNCQIYTFWISRPIAFWKSTVYGMFWLCTPYSPFRMGSVNTSLSYNVKRLQQKASLHWIGAVGVAGLNNALSGLLSNSMALMKGWVAFLSRTDWNGKQRMLRIVTLGEWGQPRHNGDSSGFVSQFHWWMDGI